MEFLQGGDIIVTAIIGGFLALWAAKQEARSQRRKHRLKRVGR